MSGMKSWSTTAASNVLANTGFTMDEGQAPSTVNDSVRQLMADVRAEWAQGASITSAATVDLSTSTGGYVTITGSTGPITSFGTVSAGIRRKLLFTGTPIITHNGTTLILPFGASITVVAGDMCEAMSEGSGNWRILWYIRSGNFPPITKRKTADESVTSSTTLQDDDHLTFSIAANEEWNIDYQLHVSSSANLSNMGMKAAITVPTGCTLDALGQITTIDKNTATSGTAMDFTTASFNNTDVGMRIKVWVLNGATAGSVTLQWCQSTSFGTALKLLKGSCFFATRVA